MLGCADPSWASNDKYIDLKLYQFGHKAWVTIALSLNVAILNQDVFPLDITEISQPLRDAPDIGPRIGRVAGRRHVSDPWDFPRLLRIGRQGKGKEHGAKHQSRNSLIHFSILRPYTPRLFDHLVSPCEHLRWNRQSNLFRGLQVNDEFKLRRLLYRQISRFGAFQDLVHVNSSAPMEVNDVCPIGHEATGFHKLLLEVNSRQAIFAGKLDDPFSFGEKLTTSGRHDRAHLFLLCGLKGAL